MQMIAHTLRIFCSHSFPCKDFPVPSPTSSEIPLPTNGFHPWCDGGELVLGWEEFLQAVTRREPKALESSNAQPDWSEWPEGSQYMPQ